MMVSRAMISPTSSTRFIFATPSDAPRVAALIELAYRGPDAKRGWTNEAEILVGPRTSVTQIERLIADPVSRFLTAFHGDQLVGCVLLQKHGDGAYFGMFAIAPDIQGGGLGKAMVAEAERAVAELWSAKFLRLTVISLRDKLIEWYERRGFVRTGAHEPFPFEEAAGALRTDFDLIVLEKPL
jgi:ribosomal protein S18 acetylase RimI-like enzyme